MLRGCAILSLCLLFTRSALAEDLFVDNLLGQEANDGSTESIRQGNTGPVRSIGRALQLAKFGDTIFVRNTGAPYYESITLMGLRNSGTRYRPFTIVGHGATISGLRAVPSEGWQKEKDQIWKLTLTRKGYYQLLRNGQLLTEYVPEEGVDPRETLPPGQWVSWKGSIHYRQDGIEPPEYQDFAITSDQTGISLHQVQNVFMIDLVVQHFRFDGVHAQGLCDTVELHNVSSVENGRAGVVASGASSVHIFGGSIERNGRFQILSQDRSTIDSKEAIDFGAAPESN